MALNERLNALVRAALGGASALSEIKMFGGIGFMLNGHLVVAASDRGLLVRVGKEREAEALKQPDASLMIMNGRTMNGYVRVPSEGLDDAKVRGWLALARPYVESLPAKSARKSRAKAATKTGVPRSATRSASSKARKG